MSCSLKTCLSLSLCCPVFVHGEPAGSEALQTDPSGHQQERLQLHAPGLLLALHPAIPKYLQGSTYNHHLLSTGNSGGTESYLWGSNVDTITTKIVWIKHFYLVLYHVKVLDLSNNDLNQFILLLPALRELHLSGNKFLRLPIGWLFPNLQTLTIQVRTNHISLLLSVIFASPVVTPPCSPTVKHPEHVRPFRSPVIQTTPEPPGGSEQVCLLLRLCQLLPVGH